MNNSVIIKKLDPWLSLMVHVYIMHDSLTTPTSKLIMNHYYSRKLSLELGFFPETYTWTYLICLSTWRSWLWFVRGGKRKRGKWCVRDRRWNSQILISLSIECIDLTTRLTVVFGLLILKKIHSRTLMLDRFDSFDDLNKIYCMS